MHNENRGKIAVCLPTIYRFKEDMSMATLLTAALLGVMVGVLATLWCITPRRQEYTGPVSEWEGIEDE